MLLTAIPIYCTEFCIAICIFSVYVYVLHNVGVCAICRLYLDFASGVCNLWISGCVKVVWNNFSVFMRYAFCRACHKTAILASMLGNLWIIGTKLIMLVCESKIYYFKGRRPLKRSDCIKLTHLYVITPLLILHCYTLVFVSVEKI